MLLSGTMAVLPVPGGAMPKMSCGPGEKTASVMSSWMRKGLKTVEMWRFAKFDPARRCLTLDRPLRVPDRIFI